jgi:hypothetical protein
MSEITTKTGGGLRDANTAVRKRDDKPYNVKSLIGCS